jgi:gamma-glutamylcyclotransferase
MSVYYFAFGSNMNKERMIDREAEFTEMQKGILKDWKLVFNKINPRKERAGFANIEPEKNSIVEGIIYKVNKKTIQELDGYEGVPLAYIRKTMQVTMDNDELIECEVYIANPSRVNNSLKPEKWYLNHLLKGEKYLSDEYFLNLKNIKILE